MGAGTCGPGLVKPDWLAAAAGTEVVELGLGLLVVEPGFGVLLK
jgi:hypothetical protein